MIAAMMSPKEQKAALGILVHAALADGEKSDAERAALRKMSEAFPADGLNPWLVYQEVLTGRHSIEEAARDLGSREARLLVYEMAVGVCDTDGLPNAAERAFLDRLRDALEIRGESVATNTAEQAAENVAATLPTANLPVAGAAPAVPPVLTGETLAPVDAKAIEQRVLQHAILAGALELLPQSLATMAVVPLQMKLVYSVGQDYGYTLDRGHIREFMATAGAGLAAQAVEGYARKLLGGLMRGALGKSSMGKLGQAAAGVGAGAAITFAATYAIGQLAIRYYGGGRKMDLATLKGAYSKLVEEGQSRFAQFRPAIEQRASSFSPGEIVNLVRQS